MEARLRLDKVQKCINIISDFLKRKMVALREVQLLTGLLNFACSVIVPGWAFLRRLINLTIEVHSPNFSIRLTQSLKEDLKVWLSFSSQYICKSFFLPNVWNNFDKLNFFTDAAGSLGIGAVFGDNWCYGEWPANWICKNIATLDFYPIGLSLSLSGDQLNNECVLFFTDNEALVHVNNRQSCRVFCT